tara:strand:- start:968 stop:2197 length:1230 start_codon:yes stop_codon:yes gene_type:complete
VAARPGGHLFRWTDTGIEISLERLREHHDSVSAEFWCTQNGDKRDHLYGGVRYNLVTPAGRNSIAKALAQRRNGADWAGMVEQVSIYALSTYRKQDDITHIGDLSHGTDLQFLLNPVLPLGVSTLLYGFGDIGKTTLAYMWALSVQMGHPCLGLVPQQANVLLLDWETNREIADGAVQSLHAGMNMEGTPHFAYLRCRRPLTEFAESVRAHVEALNIGLVIVDSFTKACGGERETKENALPTLAAIDMLDTTNLIITHRPKGEGSKAAYGSIYVENDVRNAFRVEGERTEGGATIGLIHHKHNLMAPLAPIGYKLAWDKLLGTSICTYDAQSIQGVVTRLSVNTQIITLLKDGPLPVVDIIDSIGRGRQTQIRNRLSDLKRAERIILLPDNRWGLASSYIKGDEEGGAS